VTLALVIVVIFASLAELWAPKEEFTPYKLCIWANARNLLVDTELVGETVDDWNRFRAALEQIPQKHWNILYAPGVSICFLTPKLVFMPESNSFSTKVSINASLAVIRRLTQGRTEYEEGLDETDDEIALHGLPTIQLDDDARGFRLTLTLREDHWDRIKHRDFFQHLDSLDTLTDKLCGTVDVLLAVIPYEEFFVHLPKAVESAKKYGDRLRQRSEMRARYGWRGKELEHYSASGDDSKTSPERSDVIEHRYFTVTHYPL